MNYENAYQLFGLIGYDLPALYAEYGCIQKLISDKFSWIIPSYNKQEAYYADLYENNWIIVAHTWSAEQSVLMNIIDKDQLRSAKYDIEGKVIDVKYIYANCYSAAFTYIQTDTNEYLIPQAGRPDFTNLENGKLYKADEALKILTESLPVAKGEYDGVSGGVGGSDSGNNLAASIVNGNIAASFVTDATNTETGQNFPINIIIIGACIISAFAVCGFIVFKKPFKRS